MSTPRRALGNGPQPQSQPAAAPQRPGPYTTSRRLRAAEADLSSSALLYRPGQLADLDRLRARGVFSARPTTSTDTRLKLPRRPSR